MILSLLVAALDHLGERAPPWAVNAVGGRAERALAMPDCPPPVRAAAGQAVERLRASRAPAAATQL